MANPVRAGLVERVDHYPSWGSAVYTRADILDALADGRWGDRRV